MGNTTMRFIFLYYGIIALTFTFSHGQDTDTLQNIESIERSYKRDVINQIKDELLKQATQEEKKVDKQKLEKIEIVASHAYSSLSHQLLQLKKSIKEAFRKKKGTSEQIHITFSLYQVDTVITVQVDRVEPADEKYAKKIRKVFKNFTFSPLPVQSTEIQLQLSVSLND